MKYFLIVLLLFSNLHADAKHHYRGLPRDEVGLMANVIGCLAHKDTAGYFNLFVPFDTLWQLVMHNPDRSPEAIRALNEIKERPESLLEFDPAYNHRIIDRFVAVLQKGEDSGIHWDQIVLQRYELDRLVITNRKLLGYDVVAPERFKGYVFVRDVLGRQTFCITITEIQKIHGYYFGGQVLNILEASSIDQYINKEQAEQKYFAWEAKVRTDDSLHEDSVRNGLVDTTLIKSDTVATTPKKVDNNLSISIPDEDSMKVRKEVVDRKYYEGMFDEEIPVQLFIRYMKDLRTGAISYYDGLYKFGDQLDYAKLVITRTPDGKWIMEDDPPVGTLELMLNGKTYTGSWTNNENGDGYDVVMKQSLITERKLEKLDKMLETGIVGSVDEDIIQKKPKPKPKDDDQGDEGY